MNKKGFTLLELLIVISIISILASIGLFSFRGAGAKAKDAKMLADINIIKTALSMYEIFESTYPTFQGLQTWEHMLQTLRNSDEININISEFRPAKNQTYCYYAGINGTDYVLVGSSLKFPENFGRGWSQDVPSAAELWQMVKVPPDSYDSACPEPVQDFDPEFDNYIPCSREDVYCVRP